jgi:hypothetical protein
MPYRYVPSPMAMAAVLYPLDEVPGATGGYGTRKLSSIYAGPILRVRRDGGSPGTQDIGAVGALLDTASMLTFVGSNNGYLDLWYDQTGNGRDIPAVARPLLVSAGSLITTLGGQPSIQFDGTDDHLQSGVLMSAFLTTAAGTVACVFQASAINTDSAPASAFDNDAVWCNDDDQVGLHLRQTGPTAQAINQDAGPLDTSSITIALDTPYVHVWQHGSVEVRSFLNNNTAQDVQTSGNTTALNTVLTVGRNYNATAYYAGVMTQLILHNTELSGANIDLLGAAMAQPYTGLTWS